MLTQADWDDLTQGWHVYLSPRGAITSCTLWEKRWRKAGGDVDRLIDCVSDNSSDCINWDGVRRDYEQMATIKYSDYRIIVVIDQGPYVGEDHEHCMQRCRKLVKDIKLAVDGITDVCITYVPEYVPEEVSE